jgi:hypothetical protein
MRDSTITVGVWPASAMEARPRLFTTLAAAFDVTFATWRADGPRPAGLIVVGVRPPPETDGIPLFVVADAAQGVQEDLRVDAGALDPRLRGIVLKGVVADPPAPSAGDQVLAVARSGPVWTVADDRHRLRVALEELPPDEVLRDVLLYRRTLAAVALIAFLRELTAVRGWRPPPLRAAIVFDDPNLRWPSYGYIDYQRLLAHADEHGYHVAIAMIPLDAGRAHGPTASLFATRPDRLSLVIHGNDHVRSELMMPADDDTARAMAAQAIRRVTRFERRSGIPVDRVMMPPHGLCSAVVTAALGAVGFDALCAIHPLPWTHRPPADLLQTGMAPTQFVAGCPVIPRFPLGCSQEEIAMRAFLDQPLVLYGHHDDLANGLEPLEVAVDRVTRLGPVDWTSVGTIARSEYQIRMSGDRATVRPHARHLSIALPPEVRALTIVAPGDAIEPAPLVGWSIGNGALRPFASSAEIGSGTVDLRLHAPHDVDPANVPQPGWSPWPRLRRAAAEARDRAQPLRRH